MTELFINKKLTLVFPPCCAGKFLSYLLIDENDSNRHAIHANGARTQPHASQSRLFWKRPRPAMTRRHVPIRTRGADPVKSSFAGSSYFMQVAVAFLIFLGLSMVLRLIIHRRPWKSKTVVITAASEFSKSTGGPFLQKRDEEREKKEKKQISQLFLSTFQRFGPADRRNKSKGNDSGAECSTVPFRDCTSAPRVHVWKPGKLNSAPAIVLILAGVFVVFFSSGPSCFRRITFDELNLVYSTTTKKERKKRWKCFWRM